MARTTVRAHHQLTIQLAAAAVEIATGIIRGCTVAKAGVEAVGKTVMIDRNGGITRDEKLCVKRLPVYTDEKTLETLMAAAKAARKRLKVREDHDDSVGARAGFADTFVHLPGDRVITDIHIFEAYRHRGVVLETADKNPEEMGLSIDFTPSFELAGDRAMMRVDLLHAVDIVDEGAITPGGLFLSAGVDSAPKVDPAKLETETAPPMAAPTDPKSPTNEEIMAALGALNTRVGECMALFTQKATVAPTPPAESEDLKAMKATLATQAETLKAITATQVQMKRERALLGFNGTSAERLALASTPAEDIEKLNAEKKPYLQMVADLRAKETTLSAGDAHARVRKSPEGAAAFQLHLAGKGVIRMVA